MKFISFLFVVPLFFLSCKDKDQKLISLNIDQVLLEEIENLDLVIFSSDFELARKKNPSKYRLIDINSLSDFNKNNLEGAEHMPLSMLLKKDNLESLKNDSRINILYGNELSSANLPAVVLSLLQHGNFKILIPDPDKNLVVSGDDFALFDYEAIYNELLANKKLESPEAVFEPLPAPKRIVVKKKKPVEEEEEGC